MKAYFGQKYYFKLNVDCQFTLVALCSELFNKPNKNVTVVSLKKCVRTSAQWAVNYKERFVLSYHSCLNQPMIWNIYDSAN